MNSAPTMSFAEACIAIAVLALTALIKLGMWAVPKRGDILESVMAFPPDLVSIAIALAAVGLCKVIPQLGLWTAAVFVISLLLLVMSIGVTRMTKMYADKGSRVGVALTVTGNFVLGLLVLAATVIILCGGLFS